MKHTRIWQFFQQKTKVIFHFWQKKYTLKLDKPSHQFQNINFALIGTACLLLTSSIAGALAWYFGSVGGQTNTILVFRATTTSFLLSLGLFFYFRYKGNYLYHQFLEEIAEGFQQGQKNEIAIEKRKAIQSFLFFSHSNWLKVAFLCWALAFVALQIQSEIHKLSLKKPETISKTIQKNISAKQRNLQKLKTSFEQHKNLAEEVQIRLKVYQKTISITEQSIQEQYVALYQASSFRSTVHKLEHQIAQIQSIAQIESLIKSDLNIYRQIKGMAEVQLFLQDKEESQAEGLINTAGNLYKSFQDLIRKYEHEIQKAQKSIQRDRLKIQELLELTVQDLNLLTELKNISQEDSLSIFKSEKTIQENKKRMTKIRKASQIKK